MATSGRWIALWEYPDNPRKWEYCRGHDGLLGI